jgi:hypothetical protein
VGISLAAADDDAATSLIDVFRGYDMQPSQAASILAQRQNKPS